VFLGAVSKICAACPQCLVLVSCLYPLCDAYVVMIVTGVVYFGDSSVSFMILLPTRTMFCMWGCKSPRIGIATPPWHIPCCGCCMLSVLFSAAVMILYPFLVYSMSCCMCVSRIASIWTLRRWGSCNRSSFFPDVMRLSGLMLRMVRVFSPCLFAIVVVLGIFSLYRLVRDLLILVRFRMRFLADRRHGFFPL